jgi:hypothetical protein
VGQIPVALSWFAQFEEKPEVLRILLEQDPGHALWGFGGRPSPVRSYLSGYVALALGKHDLAYEKLQEAVQSNCFATLFSSVDGAINRAP